VVALRERFGVSERRACSVVGLHRSTMRLTPAPVTTEEAELRAWLRRFSTDRPRWGWRRAAKMARRAGWKANNKRIRRLWREEGRRVPQRRRKKRLTGVGVAVGAMSPIRPNVIWAMDFQFDTTADGRTLKMLNVIDEFTREALAIEVGRSIDADGVVDVLDRLALTNGAPHYVRFDNGPEFVAHAVSDWCRFNSAGSLFIDPGSPWQNAWIESFNGRLRDELLNLWRFDSLLEARVIIEDWRRDYNANRPHSAHGDRTPAEFALQWATTHQPKVA
jgi:putative transposase